jgi:hypothetical protein
MSRQNHNINTDNESPPKMWQNLNFLGMALKNHKHTDEEIRNTSNSENEYCHSLKNLLSSGQLSKKLKSYNSTRSFEWV